MQSLAIVCMEHMFVRSNGELKHCESRMVTMVAEECNNLLRGLQLLKDYQKNYRLKYFDNETHSGTIVEYQYLSHHLIDVPVHEQIAVMNLLKGMSIGKFLNPKSVLLQEDD